MFVCPFEGFPWIPSTAIELTPDTISKDDGLLDDDGDYQQSGSELSCSDSGHRRSPIFREE